MTTYGVQIGQPTIPVLIRWYRDSDFAEAMPQFINPDGTPYDLTGKTLRLFIRPTYDHSVLIKMLSSEASGGIVIDDAPNGLASIQVERSEARSEIAGVGIPAGSWQHFLVLEESGAGEETTGYLDIWSGPFIAEERRIA